MKKTLATLLLATLPVLALAAAPSAATATAPLPTRTSISDPKNPGPAQGWDITRATLTAGSSQEPASLQVSFAGQATYPNGLTVWFNLDADPAPEAVLYSLFQSEYMAYSTSNWTGHGRRIADNCVHYSLRSRSVSVEFGPSCLRGSGIATTMAVSIAGTRNGVEIDYAPGKHRWSKTISAYLWARQEVSAERLPRAPGTIRV